MELVSRISSHPSTVEKIAGDKQALRTIGKPPTWLFEQLAAFIRERFGLKLFNYDLIKPTAALPGLEAPPARLPVLYLH